MDINLLLLTLGRLLRAGSALSLLRAGSALSSQTDVLGVVFALPSHLLLVTLPLLLACLRGLSCFVLVHL